MKINHTYHAYEMTKTALNMTRKMHWQIVRALFYAHTFLLVLVFGFMLSNMSTTDKHLLFDALYLSDSDVSLNGRADLLGQIWIVSSAKWIFLFSFAIYVGWPLLVRHFQRKARYELDRKTLRGSTRATEDDVVRYLSVEEKVDGIALTSKIRIPKSFETRHFLITGAPGTGKTTLISHIINDLRQRNVKAIIYDIKGGEMVSKFYRPDADLIYNPFDERSVHFNFFQILLNENRSMLTDFDAIAASVIPEEPRNPNAAFFIDTARKILAAVLQYAYRYDKFSIKELGGLLSSANLHLALVDILTDVDPKLISFIEKPDTGQTQGVISVLTQHARIFNFMQHAPGQSLFQMHDWLTSDQAGFLFMPCPADQRDTLSPIYSLFINCLANAILTMRDNPERRIFMLLDEFGTLKQMEALFDLIKLGRSKGVCFFIGLQEKAQLEQVYASYRATSILNHCNNHIIFKCNDSTTAQYASELLGDYEHEGLESTVNTSAYIREPERESLHTVKKVDRLILPSEIQALPDLHFFLKLHNTPVAECSTEYVPYPDVCEAFIPSSMFLAKTLRKKNEIAKTLVTDDERNSFEHEVEPPVKQQEYAAADLII